MASEARWATSSRRTWPSARSSSPQAPGHIILSEKLMRCSTSHLHIVAAVIHGLGKRPNNILQRIVALEYDKFRLTESLKKPVGVEGKR